MPAGTPVLYSMVFLVNKWWQPVLAKSVFLFVNLFQLLSFHWFLASKLVLPKSPISLNSTCFLVQHIWRWNYWAYSKGIQWETKWFFFLFPVYLVPRDDTLVRAHSLKLNTFRIIFNIKCWGWAVHPSAESGLKFEGVHFMRNALLPRPGYNSWNFSWLLPFLLYAQTLKP